MIITSTARAAALSAAKTENNPFFAWANLADDATLGGTSTLSGGDAFNATSGTTGDFWLPDVATTTATFEVDFGAAEELDFAAIASHNLHDLGASAQIQSSDDGSSWTQRGALTAATDGGAMAWRFVAVSARYWRLRLTGLTIGDPVAIGVVFFGNEAVMPSRVYQGVAPVIAPNQVSLASNISVGAHLLGSSVVSRGATMGLSFQHVPPTFVRGAFLPFINHYNSGGGFFFAWRPTKYTADCYYGWREGADLQPVNSGPKDYMSLDLSMRLHYGR